MSPLASWALAAMISLQPKAPWRSTYESTAEAIAKVSTAEPLFDDNGPHRTAALLVSLAWHESRFKLDAASKNQWFCLYQVGREHLGDVKAATHDAEVCTRAAVKLIRQSFETCKHLPKFEQLTMYVSGRCGHGTKSSYGRMWLGDRLVRRRPLLVD